MNSFLKKLGVFIVTALVIVIAFAFLVHLFAFKNFNFDISERNKYAIFGHSHSECAYDDGLISNSKNLSASGEAYFYTYQKVKQVLNDNDHIETIFVEYANNVIEIGIDDWIWSDKAMGYFLYWHMPFMGKEDLTFLFENHRSDILKAVSKSTRMNFVKMIGLDFTIDSKFGGFQKVENSNLESLLAKIDSTSEERQDSLVLSENNLKYLDKIVKLCKEKGVEVYFVRSPQHPLNPDLKNDPTFMEIKKERFDDVELLDFNNFPIADSEFVDLGHINYKGAKRFSVWFDSLLKSNLLSKENKQLFIDEQIEQMVLPVN